MTSTELERDLESRLKSKFKAYNKKYNPELSEDYMGHESWKHFAKNFCLNELTDIDIQREFEGTGKHVKGQSALDYPEFRVCLHSLYNGIVKLYRATGKETPEYKKKIDWVIEKPIDVGMLGKLINQIGKRVFKKDIVLSDERAGQIKESAEAALLLLADVAKTIPYSVVPGLSTAVTALQQIWQNFKSYKKIGKALANFENLLTCVTNTMQYFEENELYEDVNTIKITKIIEDCQETFDKIEENCKRKVFCRFLAKGDLERIKEKEAAILLWIDELLVMQSAENQKLTKEEFAIVKEGKRQIEQQLAEVNNEIKELKEQLSKLQCTSDKTYKKVTAAGKTTEKTYTVVTGLQGDMSEVKGRMSVMEGHMSVMKHDIRGLKEKRGDQVEGRGDPGTPISEEIEELAVEGDQASIFLPAGDKMVEKLSSQQQTSPEGEASGIIVGADQSQLPNNGGGGGSVTQSVETSETGHVSGAGNGDENVSATPDNTDNTAGPSTPTDIVQSGCYYDIVLCDPLDHPKLHDMIRTFQEGLEGLENVRVKNYYLDASGKPDIVLVEEAHQKCRFVFILLSDEPIESETPPYDMVLRFLTYATQNKEKYWNVVPVHMVENSLRLKMLIGRPLHYHRGISGWKDQVQSLLDRV